jgi:signal transduction histidine kinase
MKVRTTFTLWIALTSMASAIFFSLFVLHEMKEEFGELIDYELKDISEAVFTNIASVAATGGNAPHIQPQTINYPLSHYWIRVADGSGRIVYTTKLAEIADIPAAPNNKGYMIRRDIPFEHIWIPEDELAELKGTVDRKVKLWARFFTRTIEGQDYSVHIAKPLLLLNAEFNEVFQELILGISITILLILGVAYLVAGRILSPLVSINNMIRQIRESSLNTRIPLRKSKDELYTLSTSLNAMFDRLENSFTRQRDFIGNAAHEMKSPLTILMLGHEEMLATDPNKEIRHALERQLYSMQRLNKLIRDLLSIARLEQQDTLKREHIDLDAKIIAILEDYSEITKGKRITVTTALEPLTLAADSDKIHRLLINLIDNAIRYNKDLDGTIDITACRVKDEAVITVTNSGQTIPPEDIHHVFKQFYRVEKSRSQAYGGTGLGLTIALRIVEMHGGTLEVNSTNGITTFLVTLPIHELA